MERLIETTYTPSNDSHLRRENRTHDTPNMKQEDWTTNSVPYDIVLHKSNWDYIFWTFVFSFCLAKLNNNEQEYILK